MASAATGNMRIADAEAVASPARPAHARRRGRPDRRGRRPGHDAGGRPLIGASVAVEGGEGRAFTNDRGEYRLNLVPAGPVRLRASKVNYIASSRRVTAVAGATVSRDFRLQLPAAEREELPVR